MSLTSMSRKRQNRACGGVCAALRGGRWAQPRRRRRPARRPQRGGRSQRRLGRSSRAHVLGRSRARALTCSRAHVFTCSRAHLPFLSTPAFGTSATTHALRRATDSRKSERTRTVRSSGASRSGAGGRGEQHVEPPTTRSRDQHLRAAVAGVPGLLEGQRGFAQKAAHGSGQPPRCRRRLGTPGRQAHLLGARPAGRRPSPACRRLLPPRTGATDRARARTPSSVLAALLLPAGHPGARQCGTTVPHPSTRRYRNPPGPPPARPWRLPAWPGAACRAPSSRALSPPRLWQGPCGPHLGLPTPTLGGAWGGRARSRGLRLAAAAGRAHTAGLRRARRGRRGGGPGDY